MRTLTLLERDYTIANNTGLFSVVTSTKPHLGHALLSHVPMCPLNGTTYFQTTGAVRFIRLTDQTKSAIDYQSYVVKDKPFSGIFLKYIQALNPFWSTGTTDKATLIDQLCLNTNSPFSIQYLTLQVSSLRNDVIPLDVLPSDLRSAIYCGGTVRYNTSLQKFAIPQETIEVHVQPFLLAGDSYFAVLASGWNWEGGVKVGFAVVSAPTCAPANPVYSSGQITFTVGHYL